MKDLISIHVNAGKGEGPELTKRFNVHGFPTLLVVDASGEEIDRVVGYRPPEPFTKDVQRILAGTDTLPALRKRVAGAPDDLDAGLALAAKLGTSRPDEAGALFASLGEKAKTKDRPTQANVLLGQTAYLLTTRKKEDVQAAVLQAETFMKDFADTPAAGQAASRLGGLLTVTDPSRTLAFLEVARGAAKDAKDRFAVESLSVALHHRAIASALKRQAAAAEGDPQKLNEVAWTCFEQKVNVKAAVGWARTAVEKSNRDPAIVDTLANLLWVTGRHDEALKLEQEAADKSDKAAMKNEFARNVAKWTAEKPLIKEGGEKDEDDDDEGDEDDEK